MVDSLQIQGGMSPSRQEFKAARDSVKAVSPAERVKEVAAQQMIGQVAPSDGNSSPPAVAQSGGAEKQKKEMQAALEQAISTLNEHVQNLQRDLQFSVDKDSGRTIIKVIDSETKEVIRQIPEEEMLVIAKRLQAASGVFLVEQA